jgi:hypothetical protein
MTTRLRILQQRVRLAALESVLGGEQVPLLAVSAAMAVLPFS